MKNWVWLAASAAVLAACASGPKSNDFGDAHQPVRALLSVDAMMFAGFDGDNDLRITQAEIDSGITREFARADTNHDGSLQPIEFGAWSQIALGGGQTAPYRLDFDRNVDNTITAEEFRNEINSRAHDYDTNEDHVLTRDEFVREVGVARRPTQRIQNPNGGYGPPNGGSRPN